jgi:hypothetical protein
MRIRRERERCEEGLAAKSALGRGPRSLPRGWLDLTWRELNAREAKSKLNIDFNFLLESHYHLR